MNNGLRHEMSQSHTYESAVKLLNSLISNQQFIAAASSVSSGNSVSNCGDKLEHTRRLLRQSGLTAGQLAALDVIHVAGTKGKGSTCAFIERVLRGRGLRTGLFTSPHMLEVRERIRINGAAISRAAFASHFFRVYSAIVEQSPPESSPPNSNKCAMQPPFYFQFLTIMALHVFLEHRVDVVVLETGIGGRFDNTNVMPHPRVAVITSLGFDHQRVLGHSIQEIAANKAGIIKVSHRVLLQGTATRCCYKRGVKVVVSAEQQEYPQVWPVIERECVATKSPLYVVGKRLQHAEQPADKQNGEGGEREAEQLELEMINQRMNGPLAIAACQLWLASRNLSVTQRIEENARILDALNKTNQSSSGDGAEIAVRIPFESTRRSAKLNGQSESANKNYDEEAKAAEEEKARDWAALRDVQWPGRFHVIHLNAQLAAPPSPPHSPTTHHNMMFCLDGAHTAESMKVCADWFARKCRDTPRQRHNKLKRALIFNSTGERNAAQLMRHLIPLDFDLVCFCVIAPNLKPPADICPVEINWSEECDKLELLVNKWNDTAQSLNDTTVSTSSTTSSTTNGDKIHCPSTPQFCRFKTFEQCLAHLTSQCVTQHVENGDQNGPELLALVTGSLHLVGSALTILSPNLND